MDNRAKYAPIELTLYNADDEPIKTLSKTIVRWGIMKRAIKLSEMIKGDVSEFDADALDALTTFVCHVFDDKVTPREIDEGADIGEIFTVFRAVMQRAYQQGNG